MGSGMEQLLDKKWTKNGKRQQGVYIYLTHHTFSSSARAPRTAAVSCAVAIALMACNNNKGSTNSS